MKKKIAFVLILGMVIGIFIGDTRLFSLLFLLVGTFFIGTLARDLWLSRLFEEVEEDAVVGNEIRR